MRNSLIPLNSTGDSTAECTQVIDSTYSTPSTPRARTRDNNNVHAKTRVSRARIYTRGTRGIEWNQGTYGWNEPWKTVFCRGMTDAGLVGAV